MLFLLPVYFIKLTHEHSQKRCSVTNINGKVTIDASGGGECSANGVNIGSDNGNGSGVSAGAFNGGDLAAAFEDVAPIVCHYFYLSIAPN
jgi:hypothetical protein